MHCEPAGDISFSGFPLSSDLPMAAPVKKLDELIMQTRQQCAHDQLQDPSPVRTHIIMGAADQTGLHGCQKDTGMLQQNKKTGMCCTGLCQLCLKDLEVLWYIEGN